MKTWFIEDEALVRPSLVDVLEDRDGVARRRLHPRVAVRDVDVGRRELECRLWISTSAPAHRAPGAGPEGTIDTVAKVVEGAVGRWGYGLHGERGG